MKVWGKAHNLTLAVYKATHGFPKDEVYGLTSQLRRSSSSVGANIAEGCGRKGSVELAYFLHLALSSASELENHLLLARDLDLLSASVHDRLSNDTVEVKRMLTSFIQRLKAAC